jgi:hypothetical protein
LEGIVDGTLILILVLGPLLELSELEIKFVSPLSLSIFFRVELMVIPPFSFFLFFSILEFPNVLIFINKGMFGSGFV